MNVENKLPQAKQNVAGTSWERKLPPLEERYYYVIEEVAEILRKNGIIHRESATNRYGNVEITGIQQVRKYIRKGELAASLYKNSKKYGYIIDKLEVERFCAEKRSELIERYQKYLVTLTNSKPPQQ